MVQSEVRMVGERKSLRDKMRRAVLIDRRDVTGREVATFRLRPLEGDVFEFQAGQYATLGLEVGSSFVARAYSIASSPYSRDHLEFYINVIEQGEFTPSLFALREGDEAYYMGPKGIFTLKKSEAKQLLLIATGTGLAPYMSMLRKLHADQCQGQPHGRTITLVHGVRYSDDLGYRDELAALAAEPSFSFLYLPMVSRPAKDPNWSPELGRGRITELFVEDIARRAAALPKDLDVEEVYTRFPYRDAAVFLCGNPDMIHDSTDLLRAAGCEQIYTEEYW